MTLHKAYTVIAAQLREVAGALAAREAEEIVQRIACCERHDIFLSQSRSLLPGEESQIMQAATRRAAGTPLAYVLGRKFFHSVDLQVTPDVLIPRPDTEILVETVLTNERSGTCLFIDLCTGPGTIAAAITALRPQWSAIAADISFAALRVARHNVPATSHLVSSDLLNAFRVGTQFDFVVCNPPYISSAEIATLDAGVRDHEPHLALWGGEDGLDFYRKLSKDGPAVMRKGACLYLEIGYNQDVDVRRILFGAGWKNISFYQDLAGISRVVRAQRPDV